MRFASKYLSTHLFKDSLEVPEKPANNLGLIVIIPSYNEPELNKVLDSLACCLRPDCAVEVLVVVNSPEKASSEVLACNRNSLGVVRRTAEQVFKEKGMDWLRFYSVEASGLPHKWAGVGLARKIGMDEAVRRFDQLNRPNGIIVSLDADCRVDPNYFQSLESLFTQKKKVNACTIYFEHPLSEPGKEDENFQGIIYYELYMRYYHHALKWTGFPHSFYTVGSAFAVRADAYIAQGGMNKRQAGEDFYFIQKLIPLGGIMVLNTTRIIPSNRLSDRVPFGTGPALQRWFKGEQNLDETYSFSAFDDLKKCFALVPRFYRIKRPAYDLLISGLPEPIKRFLAEDSFYEVVDELSQNCSSLTVFEKRFWHCFNAFKVLKFLNFSRDHYYGLQRLTDACRMLLVALNEEPLTEGRVGQAADAREILCYFREKDQKE